MKGQTLKERILEKITIDKGGCWIWKGSKLKKDSGSYGQLRIGTRKDNHLFRAHRISYEQFVGFLSKELEIDHLCKNTLCVNPKHLEPVTHLVNMQRAKHSLKTECKHGHTYTTKNLYLNPKGSRECRVCRKKRHDTAGGLNIIKIV